MAQLVQVATEEEFDALLRADRAVVFVWSPWSVHALHAAALLKNWTRQDQPPVRVHRVDPDQQPFVVRWLAEQGLGGLASSCTGPVIWLRGGKVVARVISPLAYGNAALDRLTRQAFCDGTSPVSPA